MEDSFCPGCGTSVDAADNFCRRCGAGLAQARLPAVRETSLPVVWRPQVSPAVKGAAVMAAGTVGQFLLRRMVSNVLGQSRSPRKGAIQIRRPRDERDGLVEDAQIVTETVMMRRVRIRRRPD